MSVASPVANNKFNLQMIVDDGRTNTDLSEIMETNAGNNKSPIYIKQGSKDTLNLLNK